ncbi:hypothetical protein QTN47_18375 [Danxiaibacter flavus]|uniref:Uncharacterized protein n=1 Tax=Danxiaibacter flavus TaxID=3049108 RepID=A0ABV3ZIT6_9BACT|nr:hypothetical protein QNM32_18385 [Chitinophagaceae bacterium DXS]
MNKLAGTETDQYKHNCMSQDKVEQIQYEIDTWKRLLTFMMDENIWLKNRLVEILKKELGRANLTSIEAFHNSFIREDDMISVLRNDISEFSKILKSEQIIPESALIAEADNKLENIRRHISLLEKDFSRLKLDFNKYLLQHV